MLSVRYVLRGLDPGGSGMINKKHHYTIDKRSGSNLWGSGMMVDRNERSKGQTTEVAS